MWLRKTRDSATKHQGSASRMSLSCWRGASKSNFSLEESFVTLYYDNDVFIKFWEKPQ